MLVAVGGIHGNEPAGALALVRVMKQLESHSRLRCGDCVALAGNLPALAARRRFIDEDLNRSFDLERVESDADSAESRERRELWDALESVFREARGPVVLLDLHTTSGAGAPFAVFADTMVSRNFARRLSIPVVLGLEEQLAGTLIDYVGLEGHAAVGFEGGQHQDPESVDHLEAIVWIALGELGLVDVEAAWLQTERDKLVRAAAGIREAMEPARFVGREVYIDTETDWGDIDHVLVGTEDDLLGILCIADVFGLVFMVWFWSLFMFGGSIFCAVQFFRVDSTREMIAWAIGFMFGQLATAMLKMWYFMELNKNSLTREIKRVELQIARLSRRIGE